MDKHNIAAAVAEHDAIAIAAEALPLAAFCIRERMDGAGAFTPAQAAVATAAATALDAAWDALNAYTAVCPAPAPDKDNDDDAD